MKNFICCILLFAIAFIANAQERNYYVEAEQAFQRCEYAKASELYRAVFVMTGRDTDAKQRLSKECAEVQKNARIQKNAGNLEQAKILFEKLLEKNPNDAEAKNFISKYAQSAHGKVVFEPVKSELRPQKTEVINEQLFSFAQSCIDKQNYNEGVLYLEHAATGGHPVAQNDLGLFYEYGIGIPIDRKKAMEWYRLAADNGYEPAKYAIKRCQRAAPYISKIDRFITIFFPEDKSDISREGNIILSYVASIMLKERNARYRITAYKSCETGTPYENNKNAEKMAFAVANKLVSYGINGDQLITSIDNSGKNSRALTSTLITSIDNSIDNSCGDFVTICKFD